MFPNLSIATDNIYKFTCLFGLALILASIFSLVSLYSTTFDKKIALSEAIITLEANKARTKIETDTLELNKKILETVKKNEKFYNQAIGVILGIGIVLSAWGARKWKAKIQDRDDLLANLQIEKLRVEIEALKSRAQLP